MVSAIAHRGPDAQCVFVQESVGLGHARLRIIDLSESGDQPMSTQDGRYTISYNGEVYNYLDLRDRLQGVGEQFSGTSDTEVVLKCFARWGTECFAMFDGMFALAIWDSVDRRLCLARDRFGIKPLYYYHSDDEIIFGSEIKAILASGGVRRESSGAGLSQYMYYGNVTGRDTLFKNIVQLEPGSVVATQADGEVSEARWWRIEDTPAHCPSIDEAQRGVRERLGSAVRSHLISDVPVGVFLSGGIDSSMITAFASEHYGGRLNTYSVGFDFDESVNELPAARAVAKRFGTDHHELHVRGGDISEIIERLVACHDQPFADSANIPLYLLCRELSGCVKVILQGDGGDELFAGYHRHGAMSLERYARPFARLAVVLDHVVPRSSWSDRLMRFARPLAHFDPAVRLALVFTPETSKPSPMRVLGEDFGRLVAAHDPFIRFRQLYNQCYRMHRMQQVLYMDTMGVMVDTFMEKVDKATMAHGIEVRVPFLGKELTEYVLGLPASMKVRRGQKKLLLRSALRGIVPDDVLDGPKTGFGVPYGYWLKTSLRGFLCDVVLDPSLADAGLLDTAAVEKCIEEHVSGKRDRGFLLYKTLNLALWWNRYMGRESSIVTPNHGGQLN